MSNALAFETDTALAAKYHELAKATDRLGRINSDVLYSAGAEFYYRGRRRVTDMTVEAALEILNEVIAANEGESEYKRFDLLPGRKLGNTSLGQVRDAVEGRDEAIAEVERIKGEIDELETRYTGWSRFFVVTSSQGHIHSSMHCSTCRPTTTYGWLPELSGHDEAEAVEAHGPALCSVCFPSAPVEHVGGKLTKTAANKAAA